MNGEKDQYFELRNVGESFYKDAKIHKSILNVIPKDKNISILDIGCGLGQTLTALRNLGYNNCAGVDISAGAVEICRRNGLNVELIEDISMYLPEKGKYDIIIMAHVLEHIKKEKMIPIINYIREKLLKDGGSFIVAVPNAQSNTGAYWYFEDFTHEFLFTAGSLTYVLKAGGFKNINFLDPYNFAGVSFWKKIVKKLLLKLYILDNKLWNLATTSSYHKPSPAFFSYELICLAKN